VEGTPFQKMRHLFRAIIAVPKEEIDRREKEWQKERRQEAKESSEKLRKENALLVSITHTALHCHPVQVWDVFGITPDSAFDFAGIPSL